MTIFHLFQKLDRTMRNRPDANRWRVTMSDTQVEIFRRPVLTSEITLGALGIGNAPMPVPVCVCTAILTDADSQTVTIFGHDGDVIATTNTHSATQHALQYVEFYVRHIIQEQ